MANEYEVLSSIEQPVAAGERAEVIRPGQTVTHAKLKKWGQNDEQIAELVKQKAIKEA
jgi:hypothetical protein